MDSHNQELWLDGIRRHINLLREQAAGCPDEYVVPADVVLKSAMEILRQLSNGPRIGLTQDGEIFLTWDCLKIMIDSEGKMKTYEGNYAFKGSL
jgi:hypothetical protein